MNCYQCLFENRLKDVINNIISFGLNKNNIIEVNVCDVYNYLLFDYNDTY